MRVRQQVDWQKMTAYIALVALVVSALLAIVYSGQPLLDRHAFRQTQTALTSYWFVQEGFQLAYQTPVLGPPWSVPFEFPLYQLLVAWLAEALNWPLEPVGRLLSYCFMLAICVPVRSITKDLNLGNTIFYVFVGLMFSSPIYMYWGRTFMIESVALFFSILAIKYFVDIYTKHFSCGRLLALSFCMIVAILQKVTTALPVLAVLGIVVCVIEANNFFVKKDTCWKNLILLGLVGFLLPLLVGALWVVFTDYVKMSNLAGQQFTSSTLREWNWGAIDQRWSSKLLHEVIWSRIFVGNLGGIFGLFLLALPFIYKGENRYALLVIVACGLGLAPLFLFSNLHIVHDYYQFANTIFLIFALALVIGGIVNDRIGALGTVVAMLLVMGASYSSFSSSYFPYVVKQFNSENGVLAIAETLKREVPPGDQFIAFGNKWSSTFGYLSERKSFTVPKRFWQYSDVAAHPEQYVEAGALGAVVSCERERSILRSVLDFAWDNSWKVGVVGGCLLATPKKQAMPDEVSKVHCKGDIDDVKVLGDGDLAMVNISGWSIMYGSKKEIPDSIHVSISGGENYSRIVEALRVPRVNVNRQLGVSEKIFGGYSVLVPGEIPSGEYSVNVVQSKDGRSEYCEYNRQVVIGGKS